MQSRNLRGRISALTIASVLALAGPSAAQAADIGHPDGPLTQVETSADLNCDVQHALDQAPAFFAETACATLVAEGGTLYRPQVIPAGDGASPATPFTPVSQVVDATGRSSTTVVDAGTLRISQVDRYVPGQEAYRTDVTVENRGTATATPLVYRAGDCYLENSDFGTGALETARGAVACVADSGRIEQWLPITAGSRAFEAGYHEVWSRIGAQQPFDDSCRCGDRIDNGAGLSWQLSIPAGQSRTVSHLTNFSPLGIEPLDASKTADATTVDAGGANGYTITIRNPNDQDARVESITDDLPAGFTYRGGTTTGATTADPTVTGRTLSWSGPFTVPGGGSLTLHFGVTAGTTPGTYFNNAAATASDLAVTPTGDTAPVTVTASRPTRLVATPVTLQVTGLRVFLPKLNATLTSSGAPLAGRTVTFAAGGKTLCSAKTAASGTATCGDLNTTLSATLGLGYTATYAGEPGYARSSAKGELLGL